MKKTVVIEEILQKQDKLGKYYNVIRSDGEGYFVWEKNLLDGVEEGDTVQLTYEPGKYPKVTEIKLDMTAPEKKGTAIEEPAPALHRELMIAREVALKEARAAMGEIKGGDDTEMYAKQVICLANTFEPWLLRKEEVDKV